MTELALMSLNTEYSPPDTVLVPKAAPITGPMRLISTPILGGLHHRYQRVAT
jgi:hypothetical protein